MSTEGVLKSALLLMSIGEEEAAQVFKFLGPREVQKIGVAMASLKNITREQIDEVLHEFVSEADKHTALSLDSNDYIRSVLTKALGDDKAGVIIDRILQGSDTSGIEGLKWMDSAAVAELIKNEHPQIIATILVHLDRDQASEIVSCFTERLRNDVLLRIATLAMPNRIARVTDAVRAAGMPEGKYKLYDHEFTVTASGAARLGDGTLAGSTLTMQRAVQNMVELAGLPIEMIVPLATEVPARILGIGDRKGRIAAGYDADLVVLTSKFEVARVFVRGRELR